MEKIDIRYWYSLLF